MLSISLPPTPAASLDEGSRAQSSVAFLQRTDPERARLPQEVTSATLDIASVGSGLRWSGALGHGPDPQVVRLRLASQVPPAMLEAWRAEHARLIDESFLGQGTEEAGRRIRYLEWQIETAEAALYANAITQQQARADEATKVAQDVQALLQLAERHGALGGPRRRVAQRRR